MPNEPKKLPTIRDPAQMEIFQREVREILRRLWEEVGQGGQVDLDLFTSTEDGLTPASGGGTSNFLRADGTWAAPAGGVALPIDQADVTFSGTNNTLSKFSGTSLVDSQVTDDGTTVRVDGNLTLSDMTPGSLLFASTGGLVSQDNAQLYWDDSNNRLGIGTSSPTNPLSLSSPGTSDMISIRNTDATLWSNVIARDHSGTVRTSWGYGNASTADTPRQARAHWWAESGTDFVFMRGGAIPGTALGYIHSTSGNWNLGPTLGNPSSRLRVEGRVHVVNGTADEEALIVRSSVTSGYSAANYYDAGNTLRGGIGYGNSATGNANIRNLMYFYSAGADFVFTNNTRNEIQLGMTTGSTFAQMQNGSSAGVSAANTGRLRYNTTGQKFQLSANGAAYADFVTQAAGSGTTNTLPKYTAAGVVGNSGITDDGTSVGIARNTVIGSSTASNHLIYGNVASEEAVGSALDSNTNIILTDTTALAAGNGGSLLFRGVYTSGGAQAGGCQIKQSKSNAVSGELGFDLIFATRPAAAGITEAMRLRHDQSALFAGPVSVSNTTAVIRSGTGTPEGAVTAPVGSLFMRTDGGASTTFYVKESGSGNTGWIAK
jgi:hypothetical protein